MNSGTDDEHLYGNEELTGSGMTNYYLYTFAASVIIGLPLLFVALYKIYVDHQHNQEKEQAHKDTMREYRDAKQGLATSLRHEVNTTRTHYENERIEIEQGERKLRLEHGEEVRVLKAKIREQESGVNAKNREIKEIKDETIKRERRTSQEHSQQLQKANDAAIASKEECKRLQKELNRERENARKATDEIRRLRDENSKESLERRNQEYSLKDQKRKLEDNLHSLQVETESLKNQLRRAEEREKPAYNRRRFWPSASPVSATDSRTTHAPTDQSSSALSRDQQSPPQSNATSTAQHDQRHCQPPAIGSQQSARNPFRGHTH